jgi:hypothetical protein
MLEASGPVPALEIALLVQPAAAAEAAIAPLTGALHAALAGCVEHGFGALDTGLSLAFDVREGHAVVQRGGVEPLARCISGALSATALGAAQLQSFDVRLRAALPSRRTPGSPVRVD